MIRNLDIAAIRSFVAVAESGGVTRAANQLHLTQSAVSMQIKRLEQALEQPLLERVGRGVSLTVHGEQLLGYARRMLAINDEIWQRMTDDAFTGEINLGVPTDIMYPHIPEILYGFTRTYPRIKLRLISGRTQELLALHNQGKADLILTTELETGKKADFLRAEPLYWVGAINGRAWRERPLPFAQSRACIFRAWAVGALDQAGIPWIEVTDTSSCEAVRAMVSADIGICAILEGDIPELAAPIEHGGALPPLPTVRINMYPKLESATGPVRGLGDLIWHAFGAPKARAPAKGKSPLSAAS